LPHHDGRRIPKPLSRKVRAFLEEGVGLVGSEDRIRPRLLEAFLDGRKERRRARPRPSAPSCGRERNLEITPGGPSVLPDAGHGNQEAFVVDRLQEEAELPGLPATGSSPAGAASGSRGGSRRKAMRKESLFLLELRLPVEGLRRPRSTIEDTTAIHERGSSSPIDSTKRGSAGGGRPRGGEEPVDESRKKLRNSASDVGSPSSAADSARHRGMAHTKRVESVDFLLDQRLPSGASPLIGDEREEISGARGSRRSGRRPTSIEFPLPGGRWESSSSGVGA
jgi:hypothetical protein